MSLADLHTTSMSTDGNTTGAHLPVIRWCHHCRAKRLGTQCRNTAAAGRSGPRACKKAFCGSCLDRYYEESFKQVLCSTDWNCPFCRQNCKCTHCADKTFPTLRLTDEPTSSRSSSQDSSESIQQQGLMRVPRRSTKELKMELLDVIARGKRTVLQAQQLVCMSRTDNVARVRQRLDALTLIFSHLTTFHGGRRRRLRCKQEKIVKAARASVQVKLQECTKSMTPQQVATLIQHPVF
eukprot:GILK01013549.1.p1 GENE.GILK01013549.1~~GILK01013549.1.p1  ORF type:complete len:237 (-),score=8.41 GILK01013549.1:48-758(-)